MICTDEQRRTEVRAKGFNGIDGVDVGDDRRQLIVTFLAAAPEDLSPSNFRVEGGTRITGIAVQTVQPHRSADGVSNEVLVVVDRAGDLSPYRLTIVGVEGFDQRYSCTEFRFVTGCDDVDCAPTCDCPEPAGSAVEIDYLARDYASLRQALLDRLSLVMPQWTERHVPDVGIALVELLAYEGDRLSYRQDAVATEAYLNTARLRTSVRRHVRLVDYRLHDGCAARAWVCLEVSGEVVLDAADTQFSSGTEIFEPVLPGKISLFEAHNEITLWTWGDQNCCLPAGTNAATLVDGTARHRVLHLKPGDVLVLEETRGPKTAAEADRDASHRQAVRLTSVTEAVDQLFDQPILEVTWAREDALAFPFCVNARGGPDCTMHTVGVARGNVVLVEHGCSGSADEFPVPTVEPGEPDCDSPCFGCGDVEDRIRPHYPPVPVEFAPTITKASVTQHGPFPTADVVGRGQAAWLRDLPERARTRVSALLAKVPAEDLSKEDIAYLRTLFGNKTLNRLPLAKDPRTALTVLLACWADLLCDKLARVEHLTARACGGYLLTASNEGWEIGQSWGADEGAAVDPANARFHGPAATATIIDPRMALPAIALTDQHGLSWEPQHDLLDSGPDDRSFVGETDDDGRLRLRFGDDRNGQAFPLATTEDSAAKAIATYRVGNGTAGNVAAEAIDAIAVPGGRGAGVTRVRNPLPASGGTDPETVENARSQAPMDARLRQLRAVTADDYAAAAAKTPGVSRAAADLAWTGSWYEAQVAIDPVGPPPASGRLLDDARRRLHRYRRIGHDLAVSTAIQVPLHLELCVDVAPDYIAGHVRAAVLKVLGSAPGGYFHPDRLTFGEPVRVSGIVAAVATIPGVRSAEVTALDRLFGPPTPDLDSGVLPIRALEVARLDSDPARPENGRLVLTMVGGR